MVLDSFVSPETEQARQRSFSIKEKRDFVHKIDILISTGVSRRQACVCVGLPCLYYACFKKVLQKGSNCKECMDEEELWMVLIDVVQ